jgi:hypothetical protein
VLVEDFGNLGDFFDRSRALRLLLLRRQIRKRVDATYKRPAASAQSRCAARGPGSASMTSAANANIRRR